MARLERKHTQRRVIPEATSRGILSDGSLVADYYTAEPSPGKWVAVGTVMFWPARHDDGFPRWMLVGSGCSEQRAVANLRDRMKDANPPRWKIKCEPSTTATARPHQAAEAHIAGRFVVPWEIEIDDANILAETAGSEVAIN